MTLTHGKVTVNKGFLTFISGIREQKDLDTMPFGASWRKLPDGRLTKDVLLGEGGTGDVYKGRHHRKGVVAVKIANISRDEDSVCRELKFLQQFGGHKNIASFFGAYYRAPLTECSSEHLEIVLEYCGGGSLHNLISKTNGQSLKETCIGYVCYEVLKLSTAEEQKVALQMALEGFPCN
ncbi:hypothetical protein XELAEV_18016914mg [Xenopus laevis]|uniref:Protein kinase domain-containing protein n=1 Tax=Xenopus laevis TaxID=8355 RepID=A0A974HS53_XENLA|nr:hypothetical protein XELAEV_18016914mg [Xenopus laevis]